MAKKNEAKIVFSASTKEFNDAIKKSNDQMSELRAELKLNEEQMKTTGKSVEGLEDKHRILSSQLQASQDKTEALNQKVSKAVEIYGENSTEVSKLRTQLLNAQTAEEKIKQAIQACNAELEAQAEVTEEVEEAQESLADTIKRQQRSLDDMKDAYAELVARGQGAGDEAQELARSIDDLSGELKDNKKAMSDASKLADELDRSFEDVDDSADNAGEGFTVLKGTISDLASNAIQNVIGKLGEFMGYLASLPSATMELRQDMGTLTTAFDNVGFSTETATDTWKDLYAVFGEDDRAVETANNIARMAQSQQELNDWVTITTGVWATYQDSLPVEGLAEASAETAKTGTVTGGLADALNWSSEASQMFAKYMSEDVVTAEDAFNEALKECNTEQERQQLITDTLTKLYGDSAETYRDTTKAQMEAKEATADNILAEASLAEALEPVTTKFTELKTELMTALMPAMEKVSGVMLDALDWMEEHPVAVKAIATAIGVFATGLGILTGVVAIYTAVQWAMNSAVLAFMAPILAIIAVIAILAGVIVAIVHYWDDIVLAVQNAVAKVKEALQTAWDWIVNLFSGLSSWVDSNVIQPVVGFFTGLWTKIQEIWDTIVNVIQVAFMFIGEIISGAFQIITLPFQFIWENCKDIIMQAWEWIVEKVTTHINNVQLVMSTVMNAIKTAFQTVWNAIKNFLAPIIEGIKNTISTAWNNIQTVTSTVFNAVKSVATSVWNGIKTAISNVINGVKNTISNAWNSIKTTTSNVFNGIKSVATSVWNGVKSAITKPIEEAKNKIKGIIDTIKGFFSGLNIQFPKIKMPHFKISGSFSLDPPSVPSLGIDWYKDGGIMTKPTIFGWNPFNNSIMAGGEAGAEAILPIDRLEGYIVNAIEKTQQAIDMQSLAYAIEDLAHRPVQLVVNGRNFATATANDTDNVNGLRSTFKNRGLVLG